ncbi:sigma-70 family RNA polymerase sigma factor [Marixanthomonas ophiurae]|uniref:HTH HARE-type domain-containing protein n=1 Tax=Marixanthomonas ophiurae TaxID=387659 RepID=A0A3E1QDX0_9FLAO|nr:hypothetical protein [Marixanthomonas ophiurae]RFN60350.1 hypothetical protein DZ858_10020 [Marixanthomonas ophiurae]
MNKSNIKIQYVFETIPSILLKKFDLLGITNLQEVSNIDILEFSEIRGIGASVVSKLKNYQDYIEHNLIDLIELQESKTKQYFIPLDYPNLNPDSFIDLIKETVSDYLNLGNNDLLKGIINHYYGLNSSDKYTLEELSDYYQKTSERIRQLKVRTLEKIDSFLSKGIDEELRCNCINELCSNYVKLKNEVFEEKILSRETLIEFLIENYSYNNKNGEVVNLIIDLFSLHICGKVETYFTTADILIIDKSEKKKFLKTADLVLRTLKKSISPLNEMQVIINCKRKAKIITNKDIVKAIEILPEIEMIQNGDINLYQVKFEFLSSASDRAYRILIENGDTMYIDNIVSEINRRLVHSNTSKIYDRHSLAIASDNRFIALGKTGYWGLKIWGKNSVKIELLIKKALYKLDKPSSYDEIYQEVIKERPNLKESSVRSIIGRDCLKVESEKWILPEWKQKYSSLAFAKRKKREVAHEPEYRIEQRLKVIEYLNQKQSKQALASEIIKTLRPLDKNFTRVSFYKLFDQTEYFIKSKNKNRIVISLKQQDAENLAIDEFNWQSIKEKFYRDLKDSFADQTSPSYPFDLKQGIELFNELIAYNTGVSEFDGLDQRLLGNLNKFYLSASDRVDKLNYLKQFLTCLDPLLKKILFLVNNPDYNYITSKKKGLGAVIDKLDRIDPTEERYKDFRNARKYRFGKHIQTSYYYRNNDTHSANDWTELEIVKIITSCFIVYIFACSEYYNEIKNEINTT